MNNEEMNLLKYFCEKPWIKYTFTELKEISKKKSKSYLDKFLKKYLANHILKKEQIGKTAIYSLNLNFQKTLNHAGFILEKKGWDQKNIPYESLNEIIKKIPTKFFVLIITGSYANNKQTKKSDLDLVIIVDNNINVKEIYAELRHKCELNTPQIHLQVFKTEEFTEMLLEEEENYGKEIEKNKLILAGGQMYMKLVAEAIRNGFPNKHLP